MPTLDTTTFDPIDDDRSLDRLLEARVREASGAAPDPDVGDDSDQRDRLQTILDDTRLAEPDRAFALYCHGMRTSDIARIIGVSTRTIRRWLQREREIVAAESLADRAQLLLQAIESQREIARAAWIAYERECDLEDRILRGEFDVVRRRVCPAPVIIPPAARRRNVPDVPGQPDAAPISAPAVPPARTRPAAPAAPAAPPLASLTSLPSLRSALSLQPLQPLQPGQPAVPASLDSLDSEPSRASAGDLLLEEIERPRRPSRANRYLQIALVAQREIARLQGLYEHIAPPPQDVRFWIGPADNLPGGFRPGDNAPAD